MGWDGQLLSELRSSSATSCGFLPLRLMHKDTPERNEVGLSYLTRPIVRQHWILWACCCCCYVTSVMFDSVGPYRWHPTRLLCSWDSPGKNTGVGYHFLLQCMKMKSESEVVSDSSRPHGLQATRLLHPWDFPGKSTGVGCHHLLWCTHYYI